MESKELVITINDVRAVMYCSRGARKWIAKYTDLTWSEFLRYGLKVSDIRHIDDAMAQRLISLVEGRDG